MSIDLTFVSESGLCPMTKSEMLPYYLHVCETLDMTPDSELVKRLEEDNAKELAQLEGKLEDAEGNHGETEISEVLYSKAMFFTRIGSKVSLPKN